MSLEKIPKLSSSYEKTMMPWCFLISYNLSSLTGRHPWRAEAKKNRISTITTRQSADLYLNRGNSYLHQPYLHFHFPSHSFLNHLTAISLMQELEIEINSIDQRSCVTGITCLSFIGHQPQTSCFMFTICMLNLGQWQACSSNHV